MMPEEYNRKRIEAGFFTEEHIRLLVEAYQLKHPDLIEDGFFGPRTCDALEAEFKIELNVPEPSELALVTLSIALEEVGLGEEHRNNAGRDVHKYRDFPYGNNYTRPVGEWCAFFVGYCFDEASEHIGIDLPFSRRFYDDRFGRHMPIGSALRQTSRIGEAGEFIVKDGVWLGTPIPGDVFSTRRGRRGSGKGHTGFIMEMVDRRTAKTIEGNTGVFPSVVRVKTRDLEQASLVDIVRL